MSESTNPARSSSGYTAQGQLIAEHWTKLAVTYQGAVESLRSKGIDPGKATVEDLHALDMMHMGGLAATDSLAAMAGIAEGTRVLDVGCGLGGPARRMASKYEASVWGVELSKRLYQTAMQLTALVGLEGRVQFKRGSALALPFDNGEFDVVVMQHVAMQIAEKDQLFNELERVLNRDGCLAMHEIFAGDGGLPEYPLMWATEPSMSSLESLEECSARLTRLGFRVGQFLDLSEEGRQFHEMNATAWKAALKQQSGAPGLSIGATEDRLKQAQSMELNLREDRVKVGMLSSPKASS